VGPAASEDADRAGEAYVASAAKLSCLESRALSSETLPASDRHAALMDDLGVGL